MIDSILVKISNFLKDIKPFSFLELEELKELVKSMKVVIVEKDNYIFKINDKQHDCFYIINSGVIVITTIIDSEEVKLNNCLTGDIFGLRPFFSKKEYQIQAKAKEDSILFTVPIEIFKPFLIKQTEILNYFLEIYSKNYNSPLNKDINNTNLSKEDIIIDNISDNSYFNSLTYNKKPLLFNKEIIIKDVAIEMTSKLQDYALIIHGNYPIGIVTNNDFKSKVATGNVSIFETIEKIMSTTLYTVKDNIAITDAQLLMIKKDVKYICITEDGTNKSNVKGIISEHDLLISQEENPSILLKRIKESNAIEELKKIRFNLLNIIQSSISKNIPINLINSISGEISLAICTRCIELSIQKLGPPPTDFSWFCIGNQARKEQLLLTSQYNYLVFDDVPNEKYRNVKEYFLNLGKTTSILLSEIGFVTNTLGLLASNSKWCKSLSEWKDQYKKWCKEPNNSLHEFYPLFLDYELIYGSKAFEETITETIYKNLEDNLLFFDYLGNQVLKKPAAFNFFNKFILEETGEFKDLFDIKSRGLYPIVDFARLLILSLDIKGINNTYIRFKQLAIRDLKFSELYLKSAEAYLTLSKIKTLEGIKNDNTGQFINIKELSKKDKEKLKEALTVIDELEELVKRKFQLTHFS